MADRRGLLLGAHLSRVQSMAVEVMLMAEERVKVRDFVDRFRLALVAHDPGTWIERMFPGWGASEPEEQVLTVEDFDVTSSGEVEYVFTDTVTPEEAEAILQEMLANKHGVISADDADEGWV